MKLSILIIGILVLNILNASDVRVDKESDLVWQDNKIIIQEDWTSAISYCKELSLGGYQNWRLPEIDELMSISDKNNYSPAIKKYFKYTKNDYYWTITAYTSDISQAWILNFINGSASYDKKSTRYWVRCIR
ncbi:FimH-like protein [hydrothermal vent metagenome]|uniref:FimH-like protein n=1 Tax=hydrothermal vent metagenome TaxID=652676 RepID=A0A1W1CRW5_9ZZZZ